jgi:hypothetical protein
MSNTEIGIEGCYCEPRPIAVSALEAANRIMHGDGSEDDVQLVAGVLFQILTSPRWRAEWRTGREWVRLP